MRLLRKLREPMLVASVLFLVALIAGALVGRLTVLTMEERIGAKVSEELRLLANGSVHYGELFRYTLVRNFAVAVSLYVAALCIVGPWYMLARIGVRGFLVGYLAGQLSGLFRWKGILLTLAYFVPAWFVYAPVYFALYQNAYELWRIVFRKQRESETNSRNRMDFVRRVMCLAGCLLFGVVVEVWLGSLVLRIAAKRFL